MTTNTAFPVSLYTDPPPAKFSMAGAMRIVSGCDPTRPGGWSLGGRFVGGMVGSPNGKDIRETYQTTIQPSIDIGSGGQAIVIFSLSMGGKQGSGAGQKRGLIIFEADPLYQQNGATINLLGASFKVITSGLMYLATYEDGRVDAADNTAWLFQVPGYTENNAYNAFYKAACHLIAHNLRPQVTIKQPLPPAPNTTPPAQQPQQTQVAPVSQYAAIPQAGTVAQLVTPAPRINGSKGTIRKHFIDQLWDDNAEQFKGDHLPELPGDLEYSNIVSGIIFVYRRGDPDEEMLFADTVIHEMNKFTGENAAKMEALLRDQIKRLQGIAAVMGIVADAVGARKILPD